MKFVINFYSIYVEKDRLVYSRLKRHIYTWLFLVRHLTCLIAWKLHSKEFLHHIKLFPIYSFSHFPPPLAVFGSNQYFLWRLSSCFTAFFLQKFRLYHSKCMKTSQSCKREVHVCIGRHHFPLCFPCSSIEILTNILLFL